MQACSGGSYIPCFPCSCPDHSSKLVIDMTDKRDIIQHLEATPTMGGDHRMDPEVKPEPVLEVQLKSKFDDLTIWEAIKTFRKSALICLIAGIAASTDGKP